MQLTGQHFIGFETVAAGRDTFRAIDPAKGVELEPVIHEATADEIDRAVKLAEHAFEEYRHRPAQHRAAFLRAIASEIEALGDELIGRAVSETALPPARITGER